MVYISPIGPLHIKSDGTALISLKLTSRAIPTKPSDCIEEATAAWLDAYFANKPLPPLPRLNPSGSEFRRAVWRELLTIPYGATISYGTLAKRLRTSARAIGGAVGANPIAIIIPCHRVIASDGSIGGYAYGIPAKEFLLRIEK
ncbi:MAG: methylated-DNA--[protein]-cysteine S-methyltransferase [Muribaculaceae bacterium]|nr:methylated-DNA--[protein]-cysteine S-methyltransferase [Muribaculaceae bacterium]